MDLILAILLGSLAAVFIGIAAALATEYARLWGRRKKK
jgi:hypothetical protein